MSCSARPAAASAAVAAFFRLCAIGPMFSRVMVATFSISASERFSRCTLSLSAGSLTSLSRRAAVLRRCPAISSSGRLSMRPAMRPSEASASSMPLPVDAAGMIGGSLITSRAVPGLPTKSSATPLAPGSTRLDAIVARMPLATSFDSASFMLARRSTIVVASVTGSSSLRGSMPMSTGVSSVAVCGT